MALAQDARSPLALMATAMLALWGAACSGGGEPTPVPTPSNFGTPTPWPTIIQTVPPPTPAPPRGGMIEALGQEHRANLLADGRVLVSGGTTPSSRPRGLSSVEVYDPVSGEWSLTVPLSVERSGHSATTLTDGTVLVAGGFGLGWPT